MRPEQLRALQAPLKEKDRTQPEAADVVLDGARGSCWGVVVAVSCGAVVWWWQLHQGVRDASSAGRDATSPDEREREPAEPE